MLGCSGMELWVSSSAFLLLICFFPITKTSSDSDRLSCGPGVGNLGATYPNGDIHIRHGSPLEIYCMLRTSVTNYNSSSLVFFRGDIEVSDEFVTKVNETTIRLYVKNPPPSVSMYYCKLKTSSKNLTGVCLNYVLVGYPPKPVKNFTCISRNWQSLNCSWIPVNNYIKTYYKLYYYERMNRNRQYHCPGESPLVRNYCVWNESSEPVYRAVLESFYFKMEISNELGNCTKTYKVDHFAVVIPNKAVNLTLVEATSNSLCIAWEPPVSLYSFPPGIETKVKYQSKWDSPKDWQLVNTSHLNTDINKTVLLNLTGLKYAHTLYDIRVLLKSHAAKDAPEWWSEPATITLRTKATVPGMSPKTDIGSFEIRSMNSMRDIYIYWQQIPKNMENGDNFEYKVIHIEEFVDGNSFVRNIAPSEITKAFAKFTNMTNNRYKFTVVSANKEGYSKDVSELTIPSQNSKLAEPVLFTKIDHNGGVYELSWRHPDDKRVQSYSVFWCENRLDRPYDCVGYLDWKNVGNITEKNITLQEQKIYQFAISANGEFSSSGMLWARCTVLPDQARNKLKNTWIGVQGSTFFEVKWKLDCFERVRIHGFVIEFCPIRNPNNASCKESIRNKTIYGEPKHANITGLKPYTTYKVQVAVKTNNLQGMWSDPMLVTTLEDAPDMGPENVTLLAVTNTTISLSWSPPPSLNGVLRNYQIKWNDNSTKVENKSDIVIKELTGLPSNKLFNITLSACTVKCSPPSKPLLVKTEIGNPSQISAPRVKFVNTTEVMYVSWSKPSIPGGPVDYYEVKMDLSDGTTNRKPQYFKKRRNSLTIPTPECKKASMYYKVYVRAVNEGANGTVFYGPWSPPAGDNCYIQTTGFSTAAMVLFALIALLGTLSGLLFFSRCVWLRFKAMQNVGVKLPPQLELNSVFKDKSVVDLPIAAHVCSASLKPHHLPAELLDENTTPDQQLLLDNKIKDENSCDSPCDELDMALDTGSGEGHVESSGCGSGHDSVSSSITAGTHITDSGTEADERPASPDVFSQSPRRLSDLRQRNITGASSGGGGGSGEGYSRLAAAPTGYVTLPQGTRTYVSHTHLWPHNGSVQQCHKGYVIAPPLSSNTYSKVSLLPATGLKVTSSREHCADSESSARSDGQLSVNPASSI